MNTEAKKIATISTKPFFIIFKILLLIALLFLAVSFSFKILETLLSTGDDAQIESPISSVEIVEVPDVEQIISLAYLRCDKISEKEEFRERIILSGIERVYVSHGDYDIIFMGFNLPEEIALEYATHIEVGILKLVKIGNLEVGEGVIRVEYSRAWIGILLFAVVSIILWVFVIDLFFSLKLTLETFFNTFFISDNVAKPATLLGDYNKFSDTFSRILKLYKENKGYALVYQIISLGSTIVALIILFYFNSNSEVSFTLRPMHRNIAICLCFFLIINSYWVINQLEMKFGDLKCLVLFMMPIIWIYLASIIFIIRIPESLMGWMVLIVALTLAVPLSFFLGFVLAGIALIYYLPVRFLCDHTQAPEPNQKTKSTITPMAAEKQTVPII